MSSEEAKTNDLSLLLGKESGDTVKLKTESGEKVYKIHRLSLGDLAELEEFTGISMSTWQQKNPFDSLKSMIFILYLSFKKTSLKEVVTYDDIANMFGINDLDKVAKIVTRILDLSGFSQNTELKKENNPGN